MADFILTLEKALLRRTRKVPYPYQRVDARWLSKKRRAQIFHDPGLGKTLIILLALPPTHGALVCCPGVAKRKWAKDIREARPDLRPVVIEGRRAFRWPRPGEVVIVNWEALPYSYREFRSAHLRSLSKRVKVRSEVQRELRLIQRSRVRLTLPYPRTTCVGDELHKCMNHKAKMTWRWRELSAMALAHDGRSWGATGTPLVNRRRELYEVLEAAGLGTLLFGSFEEFCRLADEDPDEYGRRLRTATRGRAAADVLPDLPPIRREVLPVKLKAAVRLRCDQLVTALRGRGIRLDDLDLATLRQLTAPKSPFKQAVSTVRASLASAKIPAMLDLLDELKAEGVPAVLVGSAHRRPILEMAERAAATCILGGYSHEEKFKRAEAFQRGDFRECGLTYAAAGEAIDLYRSDRAVQVDIPWTLKALTQFEGRMKRIGSTAQAILCTWLTADHPLEMRVAELLKEKADEVVKHVEPSTRRPVRKAV